MVVEKIEVIRHIKGKQYHRIQGRNQTNTHQYRDGLQILKLGMYVKGFLSIIGNQLIALDQIYSTMHQSRGSSQHPGKVPILWRIEHKKQQYYVHQRRQQMKQPFSIIDGGGCQQRSNIKVEKGAIQEKQNILYYSYQINFLTNLLDLPQ